jgi:hypothetical protein
MMKQNTKRALNGLLTLVFAVGLGIAALADGYEQNITFYLDGKVGNEVVKKGTYTVSIPESAQGTIEIKVGKKVVAAPFTKRANETEAQADKMTYRENSDGSRTISTITPRGRKFTLVLQENGGSVANN